MASKKLAVSFIQEFVLGFGFISGVFTRIGIDPEAEIIKAFASIIETLSPNSGFSLIFWLLPIASTIVSIIGSLVIGGWLGLIAVVLAFLGGVFLDNVIGITLLLVGVVLGLIAPLMRPFEGLRRQI